MYVANSYITYIYIDSYHLSQYNDIIQVVMDTDCPNEYAQYSVVFRFVVSFLVHLPIFVNVVSLTWGHMCKNVGIYTERIVIGMYCMSMLILISIFHG